MRSVEIRAADQVDLPLGTKLLQPQPCLDAARRRIIPPVELHEIEPVAFQPLERTVDSGARFFAGEVRQAFEVGDEFGMHLDLPQRSRAVALRIFGAKFSDKLFHARVDVGAVEGGNARFAIDDKILDSLASIEAPMSASELPAATDNPRNLIARPEGKALDAAFVARMERSGMRGHRAAH